MRRYLNVAASGRVAAPVQKDAVCQLGITGAAEQAPQQEQNENASIQQCRPFVAINLQRVKQ